jgi:ribosomal protein S18 acetylase RimI-like enzyme
MLEIDIIDINEDNISEHPPRCFLKPDNPAYLTKRDWLIKRFKEDFKIKQMYTTDKNKLIGFIEYVKGENAWRPVDAKDYLFIHCIWIYPNANKNKGYGSMLINEVFKDAEKQNKHGVATIASDDAFMADKNIFLKNGFEIVEESNPYSLMIKKFKKGPLPKFKNWQKQLEKYKGLHIVYTNQCPWVSRSITEIQDIINKYKLDITIKELKTPEEAQNAPSIYATFNLIKDGKILADHYISNKRFENIIKKEIR